MEAHLHMWLSLLIRWAHFIVGIAWIGASFYFNWLENHLQRQNKSDGIAGDLWAVHGGGFYYLKKFAVAPDTLPPMLHWFKWEAYMTWVSGMALLIVVFYWNAQSYMLNPEVPGVTAAIAIFIGLLSLLSSWIFYDLLCRSPLSQREWALGLAILFWFTGLAWTLDHWLSARAAFIHVGAAIGTVMVANVFRVIIPAQKELVNAVLDDRKPDVSKAKNALQRSRHNNYFTLPVLFIMLSGHYPAIYSQPDAWILLLIFSIAAISVRHYFNIRHHQGFTAWPLIPAAILFVALILLTAPTAPTTHTQDRNTGVVTDDQVFEIINSRCVGCHSPTPTLAALTAAPLGVELDTKEKLLQRSERVYQTVVMTYSMPLGNLTGMTVDERAAIGVWFEALNPSSDRSKN
jgi:uncharacterized membrane protein